MTENTNETTTISHRDAKLAELREDRVKLEEKIAKLDERIASLENEAANEETIAALANGSEVTYIYGRAANKRVLQGTVRVAGRNDKGVVQLKVESGEGFDAEFHLIDSSALLFNQEQVDAALADIQKAKEEAASKTKKEGE